MSGRGTPRTVAVSTDGRELAELVEGLGDRSRSVVGLCGAPGAGKSALASTLVRLVGPPAVTVPMDGFHLADVELRRLGLIGRKGAPETFDAWGYAALLRRLRERPGHRVYAPGFARDLEQPLAGAIPVDPEAALVVTEGNYLLLDRPGWREVRGLLDEVWYLHTDERLRRQRLVARHVASGRSPAEARAWVERVDEPNARLVALSGGRADVLLDVTEWVPPDEV